MTVYRAPSAVAGAEIREKGSRFRALIAPAGDEEVARGILESQRARERDATHHCWAWRLGPSGAERSSDDGEPAGTAGKPILQVLRGAELSDVIAIVTRWYGGTKLGKGGLARAYSGAVKEALAQLATEQRWPTVELQVDLAYERLGALKRLVHPPEIVIAGEEYGRQVRVRLVVRADRLAEIRDALAGLGAVVEASSARPSAPR